MTTLSVLAAAQSRIDDGDDLPGDREAAARLDRVLEAAALRVLAIETARDLDYWREWHAQACDDEETCNHYEPVEA